MSASVSSSIIETNLDFIRRRIEEVRAEKQRELQAAELPTGEKPWNISMTEDTGMYAVGLLVSATEYYADWREMSRVSSEWQAEWARRNMTGSNVA